MIAKKPQKIHVKAAETYVARVKSGKIPACKWVQLACERHRRDMASSITAGFRYRFDRDKAERACKFLELLTHTKGEWAKKPLKLEPWQQFIVASLFGWVGKTTGYRRFRKARLYVPRKNGKSIFGAALGLLMFRFDSEPGAEVYCGATSEKQAYEVFKPARQMCHNSPQLVAAGGIIVNVSSLVSADGSKFEPIIGKPGDGSSPHCSICDEFHEHKTDELIATMETGMGARRQPMSIVTSTAGVDTAGPCREDWKICERILENLGGFEDDTRFCIIYTIDPEDRWDCEESLIKANPNWGISVGCDYLLAEMRAAQQSAALQSRFKTKHLNQWVSSKNGYFNVSDWAALARPQIRREDYRETPSYLAGDLASKHDLVALMQLFCLPGRTYALFGKYYIPEATLQLPENQHYRNWHIAGHIEVAGEDITDLEVFKDQAIAWCKEFDVVEMPSDPNRAWGVYPALEREGIPIVEYRNTILTMSEPMKQLDALIRSGSIIHNGDPLLAWAIGNVTGKIDHKDNVYPNRDAPANKIDPVVATLMALGRAMTRDPEPAGPLIYF